MSAYRIETVKDLLFDINSVTIGSRKEQRYALADVYQATLMAEGFFPQKPISLKSNMPANLRRKVSNFCSMCINKSEMDSLVSSAKRTLLEYKVALVAWLESNNVQLDENGEPVKIDVNDLDSNLDTV